MKKIYLLMLLPVLLWSCGGEDKPKSQFVKEAEMLMSKYPNYESNKEVRKLMETEIHDFAKQFVGKPAPFEEMEFWFKRVEVNENTGERWVLFESRGQMATTDDPNGNSKYLMADVQLAVVGIVSEDVALSLDGNINARYSISGVVKEYDESDPFYVGDRMTGLYFGTFLIESMKVEKIEK